MNDSMAERRELINKVVVYLEGYMKRYDGSHDFTHLQRVVGLSQTIYDQLQTSSAPTSSSTQQPALDPTVITLSALLHDVGDNKYLAEGEDPKTMVRDVLLGFGAEKSLADKIQAICTGVSFTSEIKDVDHVKRLIAEHPELAVVQDADRIDAMGAVGVGRLFTYGGAVMKRGMESSMSAFESKLFARGPMMKTEPGKQMAKQRMEILRTFRGWWDEEVKIAVVGASILSSAAEQEKEKEHT
ncbi:Uncharacterized protein LOCC1_G000259 [Lachnellula occidentalis]|uniref:HD/PDEase domain-containing protein n=1 Tax=Lachnellula occidentalis TaxID=215460 RepID=A0A8H8SA37_9HELO|nr:Uncharacterized protein LOCC1_G000259 [Lachnellula occidentalis]